MPLFALGNVQPASTTTGLPATQNAPALLGQPVTAHFMVLAGLFQALGTNTSSVYICDRATPNLALNVFVEVPAPGTNPPTRPAAVVGDPTKQTPNSIDLSVCFIVPAVAGEGVRVMGMK